MDESEDRITDTLRSIKKTASDSISENIGDADPSLYAIAIAEKKISNGEL